MYSTICGFSSNMTECMCVCPYPYEWPFYGKMKNVLWLKIHEMNDFSNERLQHYPSFQEFPVLVSGIYYIYVCKKETNPKIFKQRPRMELLCLKPSFYSFLVFSFQSEKDLNLNMHTAQFPFLKLL